MHSSSLIVAALTGGAAAYPWVAQVPGVDSSMLPKQRRQQTNPGGPGSAETCPFNPVHLGAAPFNPDYPYNGAKDGLPGLGKGGYQVPAPGDTAHAFTAPDYSIDIRGPCPGMNTLANHNFISHDGITTYNELVDAQQNVFNTGYDLANFLTVLGLTTTNGDPVTEKLSIGCDATTRTSSDPAVTGSEPGLDGHNKFEQDTSLSRTDYFLGGGDNYTPNGTIFGQVVDIANGHFDQAAMAEVRYARYMDSRNRNPNFYFGPLGLLMFGAGSFLYELMPSGPDYVPDLATVSTFFGATKASDGTWSFDDERIPDNWYTRQTPFTLVDTGNQINALYLAHPVEFGGNAGQGNFIALDHPGFSLNGKLTITDAPGLTCYLYQLATERQPSSLDGFFTPTLAMVDWAAEKLGPQFKNYGCPIGLTR